MSYSLYKRLIQKNIQKGIKRFALSWIKWLRYRETNRLPRFDIQTYTKSNRLIRLDKKTDQKGEWICKLF